MKKKLLSGKMGSILIPSEAFFRYRDDALGQIAVQYVGPPLSGALLLKLIVYAKGKMRIDLDSALSSIFDILEDAKVVVNDNEIRWVIGAKNPGGKDWTCLVEIYCRKGDDGDPIESLTVKL